MAKKATGKARKKTGGKAQKKTKEKLDSIDVGILPVKFSRLTPERAARWMAEEHKGFGNLIEFLLLSELKREDRQALSGLSFDFNEMARACATVLGTGKPMRICSIGNAQAKQAGNGLLEALQLLRLLHLAVTDDDLEDACLPPSVFRALGQIAEGATRIVASQQAVESKRVYEPLKVGVFSLPSPGGYAPVALVEDAQGTR